MILLNCFRKRLKLSNFIVIIFTRYKVVAYLRCGGQLQYISRCRKMCEVASFKNFENSLTTVKVMTKTKLALFYLGHGVPG